MSDSSDAITPTVTQTDVEAGHPEKYSRPREASDAEPLVKGYPSVARRMAMKPQQAIFRRFSALNAQNLLYLQAELHDMEQDLRKIEKADSLSTEEHRARYAANYAWLEVSFLDKEGAESRRQLDHFKAIREKLKEYNEALCLQYSLAKMSAPDQFDLAELHCFLSTRPPTLTGCDSGIWGSLAVPEDYEADLVALSGRPGFEDPFTRWVTNKIIARFHRKVGVRYRESQAEYSFKFEYGKIYLRFIHALTSVLASFLPIASIIILYRVTSPLARLGIIAGFNLLFSVCLTRFTGARRSEVFAASAAFAAVQVVFINTGTNSSGLCNCPIH